MTNFKFLKIVFSAVLMAGIFTLGNFCYSQDISTTTTSPPGLETYSDKTSFENITLEECINIALHQNLNILSAHEDVKIAESSYRVSKGITSVEGDLSGSNSRSDNNDESDSAGLSVSKYFTTGATLSASAGTDRSASDSAEEDFSSDFDITLTQPLLQGRGGTSVEATAKGQKILDEEIEITRTLQNTKRSLIHNVISSYYRLIGTQRNIITAQEALDEAERLLKVAEIKKEEGLVAKIDVTRSVVQVATRKANLVSARRSYDSALQNFIDLLGLEQGTNLSIDSSINYEERSVVLEDYIKLAFENRLDWRSSQLNLERDDISLRITRLNRLPNLDASLSYSGSNSSGDFSDSWDIEDTALTVSLSWSVPLFQNHRDLKESYIQSLSSKKKSEISLENTRRGIILEVREAVIDVEEARENLNILQESIKQAEESLRLAKLSYEEGLQTYLDVLDAQNSYTSTQNSYTNALINYLVALSNLDRVVAAHPKLQEN